jgi:Insertion element 4 transposase N-terminal/Transposase DDE domain
VACRAWDGTSGRSGQSAKIFPLPGVPLSVQSATVTITRAVTVAAGVFAPGHLGELTQFAPFELVDDVLERTGAVQRRLRDLPSRVGVYFVLALGLFPGLGYARVWAKLTAGLEGLAVAAPSEKALRDLRRRLGPSPLKALFEVVAGPLAWPYAPGVAFAGLRTVAFDGCSSLHVPATARNHAWLGRIRHPNGFAGYPALRLLALAETGTRALLGAVTGTAADGETALARRLLHLLGPGMLVLADRAYDAAGFLAALAETGAQFLVRVQASRRLPVLAVLPDGSYLSRAAGLDVRVIEAHVMVTGADGSRGGDRYRLVTTLPDHRRYPAHRLVRLYHERWEIESAYYALRHTLLHGRVLRSGDRPGLEQETWALLTLYQLLRMAMTDAVATAPGTDPDRASFTTALQTATDQLTSAQAITGGPGAIGPAILATLLPPRRPRYSARTIKCPRSRYAQTATGRPRLPVTITAITITIHPARPGQPPPGRKRPPPGSHRHQVITLMNTTPGQPWTARDLAAHLALDHHYLLAKLGQWARTGHLTRISTATYAPPPNPP